MAIFLSDNDKQVLRLEFQVGRAFDVATNTDPVMLVLEHGASGVSRLSPRDSSVKCGTVVSVRSPGFHVDDFRLNEVQFQGDTTWYFTKGKPFSSET